MENRRGRLRKHLIYYLRVVDMETDQPIGDARNISKNGIMLICHQPIEANAVLRLRMILPEKIQGRESFEFYAETKWWEKGVLPNAYHVGLELKDVTRDNLCLIEYMHEHFCTEGD